MRSRRSFDRVFDPDCVAVGRVVQGLRRLQRAQRRGRARRRLRPEPTRTGKGGADQRRGAHLDGFDDRRRQTTLTGKPSVGLGLQPFFLSPLQSLLVEHLARALALFNPLLLR